jgi:hypothetical protein
MQAFTEARGANGRRRHGRQQPPYRPGRSRGSRRYAVTRYTLHVMRHAKESKDSKGGEGIRSLPRSRRSKAADVEAADRDPLTFGTLDAPPLLQTRLFRLFEWTVTRRSQRTQGGAKEPVLSQGVEGRRALTWKRRTEILRPSGPSKGQPPEVPSTRLRPLCTLRVAGRFHPPSTPWHPSSGPSFRPAFDPFALFEWPVVSTRLRPRRPLRVARRFHPPSTPSPPSSGPSWLSALYRAASARGFRWRRD